MQQNYVKRVSQSLTVGHGFSLGVPVSFKIRKADERTSTVGKIVFICCEDETKSYQSYIGT